MQPYLQARGLGRSQLFLLCLLATFIVPLIFAVSTSELFTSIIAVTLLMWAATKWKEISASAGASRTEILLGAAIMGGNVARNILGAAENTAIGPFDLFVTFTGLWIAFFGLKARRTFLIPTLYLAIFVIGFRFEETASRQIETLQFFYTGYAVGALNLLGIHAESFGTVVAVSGLNSFAYSVGPNCVGIKIMLAYAALASLMLFDLKGARSRKITLAAIGLGGAFAINLVRILAIFLSSYIIGPDIGYMIHAYLGYAVFLAWVIALWTFGFRYISRPSSVRPLM